MNKILKFTVSIATPLLAAVIGSLATFPNIQTWYATLEKPTFSPPNWIFGPVWSLLYILMGISLYVVWTHPEKQNKTKAFIAFGVQLILNVLWSVIFFGLHSPIGGLVIILGLLIAIIITMFFFWRFSKPASYLLIPYLLWVCFATILNGAIVILN